MAYVATIECFGLINRGEQAMTRLKKIQRNSPHPAHAVLLSFPVALFTAAVATDIAYLRSAEAQWTNFSSWLISGAVVFSGVVLAWAVIDVIRSRRAVRRSQLAYLAVVLIMWLVGLLSGFKHSQDGWSSVGVLGLGLSLLTATFALVAGLIAWTSWNEEGVEQCNTAR
jgi:uncharacterized membrane protein